MAGLSAKKERRPVGTVRKRKGGNISRKQIFEAHRKAWLVKQKALQESKNAEKRMKLEKITKALNKKSNKAFDKMKLSAVQEGLVSVITENLKEDITPLSLFFAATTAIAKSTDASRAQLPYLLSIVSSCVPHLSQGFLFHEHKNVFMLCEAVIAENGASNLTVLKSLKLAQRVLLSFEVPTLEIVENYEKLLKPKTFVNTDAVDVFLNSYRKLLENCALCTEFHDPSAPFIGGKKKVTVGTAQDAEGNTGGQSGPASPLTVFDKKEHGVYRLNPLQLFFTKALPNFIDLCVSMLSEYPPRGVSDTIFNQVRFLFRRCFSPYIVESREGRHVLDGLLSAQLLSLLKPVFKDYWVPAIELLEALFDKLSYLKRVPGSTPFHCLADDEAAKRREQGGEPSATAHTGKYLLFAERFPSTVFLLKVLNKLRGMDDARLNGKIERAMVAMAKGMTMREFTEIIPFDPREAYATELEEERRAASGRNSDEEGDDDDDDEDGNEEAGDRSARGGGGHLRGRGGAAQRKKKTSQELWATSYTLNVVKKAASHDSLPFFVEHFFPFIQHAAKHAKEAERAGRRDEFHRWSALLLQLWRVAMGFCTFPLEVDNDSFRDLAKQLVGLLHVSTSGSAMSSAFFVDTAATAIHVLCDGYYRLSQLEDDDDADDAGDGDAASDFEDISSSSGDDDDVEGGEKERKISRSGREAGRGVAGSDADEDDEDGRRDGSRGLFAASHVRKHRRRGKQLTTVKDALEDDVNYLSYNDPGWNPHRYHNICQAKAAYVCTAILAKYSGNIMPRLCNVFEQHDSTAVLLAIQSFSKVCTPAVMTSILDGILSVGSAIAAHVGESREEHEAEGRTKAGSAPLASTRRVVLDIACAVVPQLPAEHVLALFNDVIEPVLMDPAPDSRLLQKKAYKLLYAMFEHRVKDIFPLFPRIFGLLTIGRQHVTASGIKMRVKCLSWALDACKMFYPDQLLPIIKATVGEVVLFSRENSSEVRKLTMDTLEKMERYATQAAGAPPTFLLHLVVAGLSGKTPMMVSGSLVCMAKIVYLTHDTLAEKDLQAAVALGFQLMASAMQEVRTAASIFARMVLKLGKRSPAVHAACEKALPKLLYAIALVTSQPRVSSNTRMQMRVLLEKCITAFTIEKIDPIFPLGSKNFLRYTHRMLRREEKKDERALKKQQQNEFDQFFMGAGRNADARGLAMRAGGADAEDAGDDLLEAGALSTFVARHTQTSSVMYPGVGSSSFRPGGGNGGRGGDAEETGDEYDNMHLEFQDGKLRIMSVEEKRREVEGRRRQAMAEQLLRRNRGALLNGDAVNEAATSGVKRGRDDGDGGDAEDFENDELILRYGSKTSDDAVARATSAFAKGRGGGVAGAKATSVGPSANQIARLRDQKEARREQKRQRVEEDIRKGDEFQGSGAGDVRRGNVEPFAYVPLNRRYMNKRHARQALHRFEVINNKMLKGEKAKAANEGK